MNITVALAVGSAILGGLVLFFKRKSDSAQALLSLFDLKDKINKSDAKIEVNNERLKQEESARDAIVSDLNKEKSKEMTPDELEKFFKDRFSR